MCRGESLERESGFAPATSSLARKHSTTELLPHIETIIFFFPNYDCCLLPGRAGSGLTSFAGLRRKLLPHGGHGRNRTAPLVVEAWRRFVPPYGGIVPQPALEATGGIEPPNTGFADPCLTTWLRGREPPERDRDPVFLFILLGAGQTRAWTLPRPELVEGAGTWRILS